MNEKGMEYAGFTQRAGAFFIDAFILIAIIFLVDFLAIYFFFKDWIYDFKGNIKENTYSVNIEMHNYPIGIDLLRIFNALLILSYHAILESTNKMTSFGKRIVGIQVVSNEGKLSLFSASL
ncbi:MAG: RDD family protein [Flavobacteriales bacterium]